jgi:hypothetical protein
MTLSAPNKGGRPRIHASNAAKVAAWRAKRKKTEVSLHCPIGEETVSPPTTDSQADWDTYLRKIGLTKTKGLYMADAARGCGKLHSGGNDPNNLVRLEERANNPKRRMGHGPDA